MAKTRTRLQPKTIHPADTRHPRINDPLMINLGALLQAALARPR